VVAGSVGIAALAFVLYFGWDGGTLGRWLGGLLAWLVGLLAFAAPVLLCYAAYVLAAGEERRPRRSLTVGLCLGYRSVKIQPLRAFQFASKRKELPGFLGQEQVDAWISHGPGGDVVGR